MIKYNGKDVIPRIDDKEISRVMYNGKQIYPTNNVIEVQKVDAIAGDICAYDGTNKRFFRFVDEGATDNIKKYTPIGIVVVPASHGHYVDDKCAIMSLNHMRCDTPTAGGTYQSMYWGVDSTDIDTLPNLDQVPYVGSNGSVTDTVIGITESAYLPSDYNSFTAVVNPYDEKTNYYLNNNDKYIPSPYNNDDTFNSNYSLTDSPSSTANCLSDFDGYNNTKKILAVRGDKDYSSWLPTPLTPEDYSPASCCDMYFTIGTNQGDWYLPAIGELGYVCVRRQMIHNSLNKLIQDGISFANVIVSDFYWSSSEHSNSSVMQIFIYNGNIYGRNKNRTCYTRAFTLI